MSLFDSHCVVYYKTQNGHLVVFMPIEGYMLHTDLEAFVWLNKI